MIENQPNKGLKFFGKWIVTPLFAIGSSIITTIAVSSLPAFAGFSIPLMMAILAATFLAEVMFNIYLFKDSVPETLLELSSGNIFRNQSSLKKIMLGLGIFCALGGGLSLGALTYISGVTAFTAVLGLLSLSVPFLAMTSAALLAVMGLFAITGLFIKWIGHAIKNDLHKQIPSFFTEIFTRDLRKHIAQQILEGVFKLLFTGIFIALTVVGSIAILGTMQKGLYNFLSLIPKANVLAVKIASGVISYGLMGIARTPWVLQSLCNVSYVIGDWTGKKIYGGIVAITKLFKKEQQLPNVYDNSNHTEEGAISSIVKITAVLVHGFCFGALAKSGGGNVLASVLKTFKVPSSSASDLGQTAALVSGGMVAVGTSTFAFFPQLKPQNVEKVAAPNEENLGEDQYLFSRVRSNSTITPQDGL